jgi:glycosyltransferase involved in cell wall biosynthesis
VKILVISNLFPPHALGGYEILCAQICGILQERGHDIFVLTSDHRVTPDQEGQGQSKSAFDVHRSLQLYLPFGEPAALLRRRRHQVGKRNYRTAGDVIQRIKPDLVFIWSQLRLTLGAARASQDSGVPTAYTFNDDHLAGYLPAQLKASPRDWLRFIADRFIFPDITLRGLQLHHLTCISQRLKTDLLARGLPIDNAKVIYQGIPVEQFPCKEKPGRINAPARLLYVGQLHDYKGVHTLVEAAQQLAKPDTGLPLTVTIIGAGDEEYAAHLKNLAAGPAVVEFGGRVAHAELPRIYREHDIFVFPSIWVEPFGLTHLEAMASGTPVISTAHGGHGEFLRDGENALVFEKENSEQLAQKIMRVISDDKLSHHLAAEARAMVERNFTLERYATDLESFLYQARGE